MKLEKVQEQFRKASFDNIFVNVKNGSIAKNTSCWLADKTEFEDGDGFSTTVIYGGSESAWFPGQTGYITVDTLKDWEFPDSKAIPIEIMNILLQLQITNLKNVIQKYIRTEPQDFFI